MARDLDFRTVRRPKNASPAPVVRQPKQTRQAGILATLIFLGLILIGFGLLYEANLAPIPGSQKTTEKTSPSNNQKPSNLDRLNQTAGDRTAPENRVRDSIQVYDSGAGTASVEEAIKALADEQLTAKNVGKSQFEYDKTYIWYSTGFEDQAKKIAAVLIGRQTAVKESKVSGPFDILIYLGKN